MTTRAWRIFKPKWESSAFSGEGAKRSGGRWNSRGTAMVYTSQSSSLAILELTVHLDSGIKASLHYRLCEVEIEDDLILTLDLTSLPTNWKDVPAPFALQQIGDEWVRDHSSAVLRVPSAVNEKESNLLLNPRHPDFSKISIGTPVDFWLDPRLLS